MQRKIKLKRSTKQTILVAIISFIVIGLAFGIAYILNVRQIENRYKTKLNEKEIVITQNTKQVYVAKSKIIRGKEIKLDNVKRKEVLSSQPEGSYIKEKDINSIAVVDIEKDTQILKSMITSSEIESGLRESEYNMFYLSNNLKENDVVDIRILFPNGEDYVVLSKKSLRNLSINNNDCYLWLSNSEISMISSAIIDAYLEKGAKLYTVKYIEPTIQEATCITYQPTNAAIAAMKKDPNILNTATNALSKKARSDLDLRLQQFYQDYNNEIDWDKSRTQNNTENKATEESQVTVPSSSNNYNSESDNERVEYVD